MPCIGAGVSVRGEVRESLENLGGKGRGVRAVLDRMHSKK